MQTNSSQNQIETAKPIEYLVFGHVSADLTDTGSRLGGSAAFSGLTVKALGLSTGVVTSYSEELNVSPLKELWLHNKPSQNTTTFKNISDGVHRIQYLFQVAEFLTAEDCPELSVSPSIIHLGPVADEVHPEILNCYPSSLKCLTPQGWFRKTNSDKIVKYQEWQSWEYTLSKADIAVLSLEDVQSNEVLIAKMASTIPILVVTENNRGARVYWHSDARFINAPEVKYVDDTGAGDIFAGAFFYRYFYTRDPWEAGRFAVLLASWSVTRMHLYSIPTSEEIKRAKLELLG